MSRVIRQLSQPVKRAAKRTRLPSALLQETLGETYFQHKPAAPESNHGTRSVPATRRLWLMCTAVGAAGLVVGWLAGASLKPTPPIIPPTDAPPQVALSVISLPNPALPRQPAEGNAAQRYMVWPMTISHQLQRMWVLRKGPAWLQTEGSALRFDYQLNAADSQRAALWLMVPEGSLPDKVNQLEFFLRGDTQRSYPQRLIVEIVTEAGRSGYVVDGIRDRWQRYTIPATALSPLASFDGLREIHWVVEGQGLNVPTGTLYFEQVSLTTGR